MLTKKVETELSAAEVNFADPTQIGNDGEFCRIDCYVIINHKPLWKIFSPLSQLFVDEMKKFAEQNSSNDLQFRTSLQIQDRTFFDIGQL